METVFWDWHGVLAQQRYWQRPQRRTEALGALRDAVYGRSAPMQDWMRGRVTTAELAARCGAHVDPDLLVEQLYAGFTVAEVLNVALLSTVRALLPQARHWVVTDNVDVFSRYLPGQPWWRSAFDGFTNSADHGVLKRDDPGLFEIAVRAANANPRDCLLLDDSPENCARFTALGGRAIVVARDVA